MMDNYRRILDTAGDLIVTFDPQGLLTYANSAAVHFLGHSAESLVEQSFEDFIAPAGRDRFQVAVDRLGQYLEDEVRLELPLIRHDGSEIWVELLLTPLHNSVGQLSYIVGVIRDISERLQADAELQRRLNELATLRRIDVELTQQLEIDYVLSMALDAVVRLTAADAGVIELMREGKLYKGTIVGHYPPAFLESYPRTPGGIVKRCLEQRKPELVLDVLKDPDYIAHNPQTRAQMTIPLISHDRLIGVQFLETHNPARFTESVFELIQLITTRIAGAVDNAQLHDTMRQHLAELQDLYAQISSLEQLKTDMIRIAAHDLGSPLTSILGGIDMLASGPLTDQQKEYADMVYDAAQQIHKIIRDILSLQRIEELAQGTIDAPVNLTDLVREVCKAQQQSAAHRGQIFSLNLPDELIIVQGDMAQLREAIVNLIGNAIKYTPEGGSVSVSLAQKSSDCEFLVRDTGYGIPADQQERLFQPFYRVKTPEVKAVQGTGLGLHLVKNIIERHGGRMCFESAYGKGSSFGFLLPVS